ncbi:WXG100 family type VII secretion target [Quadrisphaera oryzae]|uniref:WXG100 family type VII secretion target n=1 Tax=Quadrisphaera TaxID=317661 RepID=UPI0016450371|nr:WXG100 family type VII secretion target [Quadrisphaera sp. RL12-1S]MBC3764159.1 WXG100 family type VII secretion target [Quadrisphaera sp. RL12-1S]
MAMVGMNVEQVEGVARQLSDAGQQIQQLSAKLSSLLQSAEWVGNDQQQFLNEWNGTHRTALQRVVDGLNQASQAASRNAREQRDVSGR